MCPTRNSVMALLDVCSKHMIMMLFLIQLKQPVFIFCIIKVVFYEKNCHLWVINNDVTDHNISKMSGNSIVKQIKLWMIIYRNIKSQFLSSYCLEA